MNHSPSLKLRRTNVRYRVAGIALALGFAAIAASPAVAMAIAALPAAAKQTLPLPIPASAVTHPVPFSLLASKATVSTAARGPLPLPPGFSIDQPNALPSTELKPAPTPPETVIAVRPTGIDWADVGIGSGLGIVASLLAAGALVATRRRGRFVQT